MSDYFQIINKNRIPNIYQIMEEFLKMIIISKNDALLECTNNNLTREESDIV